MRTLTLVLCWLLLLGAKARAERVTLAQALAEATAARPFVLAAREDADAAQASVQEARSKLLPRQSLSENLLWTNEPGGSLFISLNQQDLRLSPDAGPYNHPPSRRDFETRLTLETARRAAAEAQESCRLLQERYGAGLSDLSELLLARAALDRARFGEVDAEAHLLLALGDIRFKSGTFLKSMIRDKENSQ